MSDERYIPTPEAAKKEGIGRRQAARLARESFRAGNPFPVKRGRAYEAPLSEWKKIFRPQGKVLRKPRNQYKFASENQDPDQGYSCSRAARIEGVSTSWAIRLAQRAVKRGYDWPKWESGQWIAPLPEWKRIFNDPKLVKWKKTRK